MRDLSRSRIRSSKVPVSRMIWRLSLNYPAALWVIALCPAIVSSVTSSQSRLIAVREFNQVQVRTMVTVVMMVENGRGWSWSRA
jgi:hypothetical protein